MQSQFGRASRGRDRPGVTGRRKGGPSQTGTGPVRTRRRHRGRERRTGPWMPPEIGRTRWTRSCTRRRASDRMNMPVGWPRSGMKVRRWTSDISVWGGIADIAFLLSASAGGAHQLWARVCHHRIGRLQGHRRAAPGYRFRRWTLSRWDDPALVGGWKEELPCSFRAVPPPSALKSEMALGPHHPLSATRDERLPRAAVGQARSRPQTLKKSITRFATKPAPLSAAVSSSTPI